MIGSRREADRQHSGAPVIAAKLAQHRREVRVCREDDELVAACLVLEQINDVQDHVNVCAGLALAGHGWAVDDLESGAQECVAIVLIPVGIEVAAAHEQTATLTFFVRFRQCQGIGQPADPFRWMSSESLSRIGLQLFQLGKHIVEVNEECALHVFDAPPDLLGGSLRGFRSDLFGWRPLSRLTHDTGTIGPGAIARAGRAVRWSPRSRELRPILHLAASLCRVKRQVDLQAP